MVNNRHESEKRHEHLSLGVAINEGAHRRQIQQNVPVFFFDWKRISENANSYVIVLRLPKGLREKRQIPK